MIKKSYRYCKYCDRIIPFGYDLNEHKQICKNINNGQEKRRKSSLY